MSVRGASKLSPINWVGTSVVTWLVVLVLLLSPFQRTAAQHEGEAADKSVVRLSPGAFPQLPRDIANYLAARKCKVPQPFDATRTSNVISGEFTRPGQKDWAVMCSRNRTSSILVFWNGSTRNVSEIAQAADSSFLQTIDGIGTIGYSRAISPLNKDYILQRHRWYGGPRPPRMDHQGINDAFIGKASSVLFYHRGRWLKLQGAD